MPPIGDETPEILRSTEYIWSASLKFNEEL